MSVNQASLMLGPIISALIFKDNPQIVILISSLLFLFVFFAALFYPTKANNFKEESRINQKIKIYPRAFPSVNMAHTSPF